MDSEAHSFRSEVFLYDQINVLVNSSDFNKLSLAVTLCYNVSLKITVSS